MGKEISQKNLVSIIIPALNEAKTIGAVIDVSRACKYASEVIVVSDGSTDDTAEIAREKGVVVIENETNRGKAEAMNQGVECAENDFITFVDADLKGFTGEMLEQIILPVIDGKYEMFVAVRGAAAYWTNKTTRIFPINGGERTLTKSLWRKVPKKYSSNFKIETALNYFSKKTPKGMSFKMFKGLSHTKKQVKYNYWKGVWSNVKMIGEVITVGIELYIFYTLKEGFARLFGLRKKSEV